MGVAPGGAVLGVDSSVVTLFACEDDARSSLRRLCDGLELAVAVEVGMIGCCEESGAKPSALARLGRGVVVGHERVWSACRLRAKLARPETPINIPNRDHHHRPPLTTNAHPIVHGHTTTSPRFTQNQDGMFVLSIIKVGTISSSSILGLIDCRIQSQSIPCILGCLHSRRLRAN